MARWAASQADRAAEALDAFLRDRPAAATRVKAGQAAPSAQEGEGALGVDGALPPQPRKQQTGSAAVQAFAAGAPLRLPQTDWLFHRLTVTGPAAAVTAFRAAAAGAGTIPWQLDLGSLEEDWSHLLSTRPIVR